MNARNYTQKRVLMLGIILFLATAVTEAQRGWGRPYRHNGHGWYHGPRIYSFSRPFVSIGLAGIHSRYYGGYYYRPYPGYYRTVAPPIPALPYGAKVPELPSNAQAVVIDGQKYYVSDGAYYKEEIDADNKLWYTVVGVNGELKSDNEMDENTTVGDRVGDRVEKLPPGCRTIVISGRKYFEAPSGLYYEEIISPNKVYYEVVGKPGE